MAAAVAAAPQGLDVVVFEKTAYAGGNALVSGGWLEVFEGVDDMKPDMTDGNRDMFHATLQKSLDNGVPKDFVDAVQADFDAYFAAGNTKVYDSMEYYALDYASRNGGPAKEYWLPYAHKVNDLNNWLFDQGYTVSGTLVGIVGVPVARARPCGGQGERRGLLQRVRQHGGDPEPPDHLPLRDARFRADRGRQGCGGSLWPVR